MKKVILPSDWILINGGRDALLRFPFEGDMSELKQPATGRYRLATHSELLSIAGTHYPWGLRPQNDEPTSMWRKSRMGTGGLIHSAWFLLEGGERVGGAPNVPDTGPGALRHFLLLTGGHDHDGKRNENEGHAVVWEGVPAHNAAAYRKIYLQHVATHVSMDGGGVLISPTLTETDTVFLGFKGRCMTCPNPELVSCPALKHACPDLNIELHPDWAGWTC